MSLFFTFLLLYIFALSFLKLKKGDTVYVKIAVAEAACSMWMGGYGLTGWYTQLVVFLLYWCRLASLWKVECYELSNKTHPTPPLMKSRVVMQRIGRLVISTPMSQLYLRFLQWITLYWVVPIFSILKCYCYFLLQ